jgi:hypothetical protein
MSRSLTFLLLGLVACKSAANPSDTDRNTDTACTDCGSTTATEDWDLDGDGFDDSAFGGEDCDDANAAIHPDATEVCDGVDNDCNGLIDEDDPDLDPTTLTDWYRDLDGDGFGDANGNAQRMCSGASGAVDDNTDCNDGNSDVNPGAIEIPGDCIDNDCDGVIGDGDCNGMLYMIRESDDMVRKLDPATLVFTDVGPLNVSFDYGELAWDVNLGVMYMVDGYPGDSLWTVDVGTGQATFVANHGLVKTFGLAVDPTGTLYGTNGSDGGLWTIEGFTASTVFIGQSLAVAGLTWDNTRNVLVGLGAGGDLAEIDILTGDITRLGNPGSAGNCGLAYDSERDLFWMVNWDGDLYTYDPSNGYARTLVLSNLGAHDGLTFGP